MVNINIDDYQYLQSKRWAPQNFA